MNPFIESFVILCQPSPKLIKIHLYQLQKGGGRETRKQEKSASAHGLPSLPGGCPVMLSEHTSLLGQQDQPLSFPSSQGSMARPSAGLLQAVS